MFWDYIAGQKRKQAVAEVVPSLHLVQIEFRFKLVDDLYLFIELGKRDLLTVKTTDC